MRTRWVLASGTVALAAAVGCASVLSIPDRSPEWCDRPENQHDFCDDFDHVDAGGKGWGPGTMEGGSITFVPSTDSPPNALDMSTIAQPLGTGTVAGMYNQFDTRKFDHVRLAVDVRFVSIDLASMNGLSAELGFLLLAEPNFCIGAVMTPAGIGLVMRAHSTDCTNVTPVPEDAGTFVDDAGLTEYAQVAPMPGLNQWFHIKLDVTRNPENGSGAVVFDINYPGVIGAPQIPPGFLTEAAPAVAVATSIAGPSGHVELQFDNVTVDFLPN
jgi:hypothetical protein